MRHISEAMTAALASGAAKFCHVWLLTRGDGAVLGFTDHDADIQFLGVTCQAQSGLTQGAAMQDIGLDQPGSLAISGIISADGLAAADIEAGLYDGAELRTYVIDWTAPDQYVETGAGYLAQLDATGGIDDAQGVFVAHVEGVASRLDRVIGRRFGFLCDAALGDARCGLDLAGLAVTVCDKRYRTCNGTFSNTLNFRGFPDLPGEDFLTLYPRDGDVLDGGSSGQSSGR
ncbi:DUF2163 domain-containing protein [Asticcacaulis sp. EMRT-3]|uniref:DUF2163 domain-containing protein n=1 Tax=Asticcacaulis sp. EMRT-3 TaxID=3040349 RepID=UPI0024AFFFD6|nr:DUF2163 domain-containing protein [Asticcacaulis sp. EMRT-3]MDI7775377.1 DUF2163 domain-containing protein [Asticcacaulis sp. EMRT-3]